MQIQLMTQPVDAKRAVPILEHASKAIAKEMGQDLTEFEKSVRDSSEFRVNMELGCNKLFVGIAKYHAKNSKSKKQSKLWHEFISYKNHRIMVLKSAVAVFSKRYANKRLKNITFKEKPNEELAIQIAPSSLVSNNIIDAACVYAGITRAQFMKLGPKRGKVMIFRHAVAYVLRNKKGDLSVPAIKRILSRKDDSTIWYSLKVAEKRIASGDAEFIAIIDYLKKFA